MSEAFGVSRWLGMLFPSNSLMGLHCRIAAAIVRKRLRLCGKGREEIPGRPHVAKAPCRAAMNASCTVAAGMVFPFHDRSAWRRRHAGA